MTKILFVGMDVHAETIAVAVAEQDGEVRSHGVIANRVESIRKLAGKLGSAQRLRVCYEAGPTGYALYWQLAALGVACEVIAPSLIPRKPGERVKTDRRDAEKLARCYRAGELTAVWVPDADHEALRDLVRAREAAKKDQLRARHRLSKFLLRHAQRPPAGVKAWTKKYLAWVHAKVRFEQPALEATLADYLHEVEHAAERTTAATIVSELGSLSRFPSPKQLMSYSGLTPSEHSSGNRIQRGPITKSGNAHLRRVLVEAAWAYQHRPDVSGFLLRRQKKLALSEEVKRIAWKAQLRLSGRYKKLTARGKNKNETVTAVGRELLGFIWAIAVETEGQTKAIAA